MRSRVWAMLAVTGAAIGTAASARPDVADARKLFAEAQMRCARDGSKLWGKSLCGPMLLVDWHDRQVWANQADGQGKLKPENGLFTGTLDADVLIANTPTEWAGTRWTQIDAPLPDMPDHLAVLMMHELFHRIQPALGLTRQEVGNRHLDTLEGRYLLQLEWRALDRALAAQTAVATRAAVLDALAFRHERQRVFANAAVEEGDLEINEGVPEYTGVMLGLANPKARIAYARSDLTAFLDAPSFVRSFAYATGPGYGLLLDRFAPGWRTRLGKASRWDAMLAAAIKAPAHAALPTKRYDDGSLRAKEERREAERLARLAKYKAALIDGPVLRLPLAHSNYQFNPQTLVPFEGHGTIYPTMRLLDDWGALTVESGGALVGDKEATVAAPGFDPAKLAGQDWTLTLNPGWKIVAGARPGDWAVTR